MANEYDFPDDDNGRVLQRMAADGIDLVSPRAVDFEHCFADEASARRFHDAVTDKVDSAELIAPDDSAGRRWEVRCRKRMVPTHSAITRTEADLDAMAQRFAGHADGWGMLSNRDGSPAD